MVELADGLGRVLRGREDIVERGGLVSLAVVQGVGIGGIVGDLVFEANHVVLPLRGTIGAAILQGGRDVVLEAGNVLVGEEHVVLNAILQPAVAARRNLAVPFELEIGVSVLAEKVLVDGGVRGGLQAAIFDGELGLRGRLFGGVDPVGEGLTVEQEDPAGGPFLRSELIVGGVESGGGQNGGGDHRLEHSKHYTALTKGMVDIRGGYPHTRGGMFANFRREIPAPSITVFVCLQALDVLTTLIGLKLGASEASFFVGQLMRVGTVGALLIAKIFAVLLVCAAVKFRRQRLIVFLNYYFAALITWNLAMIVASFVRG